MKEIGRLPARPSRRLARIATALVLYAGLTAAMYRMIGARASSEMPTIHVARAVRPAPRDVQLRDGFFYVGGERFLVQAVGWDPVRPGELPWTRTFRPEDLEEDLRRIRAAGFNTVRTWAPLLPEELALVEKHGLHVLQGIWVPPDGAFADPAFRRQVLDQVAAAVERSRGSRAILGYLVMNEPRARAVARAGLPQVRSLLHEIAITVRAVDPAAPVGYASWPGMEALDDDALDFVAFNLYTHRPREVLEGLGMRRYVELLRETIAHGRPFLVSEFGISVSPGRPLRTAGRGGASPGEQAQQLCALASKFADAGVAGTAVFQWSDGWWKNNEQAGDELTHDPYDAEEWYGLIEYESLQDRRGHPRPALAAFAQHQQVTLVEPRDGAVGAVVPVRVHAADPPQVAVRIDDANAAPIALHADGPGWWTGEVALPDGDERHQLSFTLPSRTERRVVYAEAPHAGAVEIRATNAIVEPSRDIVVALRARADLDPSAAVTVVAYSEDRYQEERIAVRLKHGRAEVHLHAPANATVMTILAFTAAPDPVAAWTAVEVRSVR